jgi:long-chain acyl-CoA synthetase
MNEQAKNINQALVAAMQTYAARTCFQIKRGRHYQNISYRRFQVLTFRLASFFRQQGISPGERIAIIADNSLEWMVAYVAGLLVGGIMVPLRPSQPAERLCFMLQNSGASVAVIQGEVQCSIVEEADEALPDLRTVLTVNDVDLSPPTKESADRLTVIPITSLLVRPITPEEQESIRIQAEDISPDALAAIHYIDGETGHPRGVAFDQAQRLETMQSMAEWFTFDQDDVSFTVLPWSYIPSLDAALHYFLSGVVNVLSEEGEAIFENLEQTSPTVILATPYALEDIYNTTMVEMNRLPESDRAVFQWALAIGKEYRAAGDKASKKLREAFARADMTFFSQIRGRMGGRLRRFYLVGAALSQPWAEFAEAIGLLPLSVYSLTKAGGFPAASRPEARRPDSCGQVAPGFQVRIADDGEVLVKRKRMRYQYWQPRQDLRQVDETEMVVDADGWLHTGDLGHFDLDGYLYLTGHKQSSLVLSRGHKIRPTPIENALMASPFVAQAAVFGHGKPYLSALIVPDLEALTAHFLPEEEDDQTLQVETSPSSTIPRWFWRQENDDQPWLTTTAHPKVKVLMDKVIAEVNARMDRLEQIKTYALLEQAFSNEATELAETMKISRQALAERYAAEIEAMYPQTPAVNAREVTQVQVIPERLQELLEKENILDAWMADAGIEFLFELARHKQIDVPSMVHICDVAAAVAQMESEEKPLSTALIVGDPSRLARILPSSEIQLLRYDHIRRMRQIVINLAKMVDGLVLGYAVDKHGYVRGIHKLEVVLDQPANFLLGPQFRHHAAISRQCDAVVFFVPAGGRQVRVFADGHLVGRYANGIWSSEDLDRLNEVVAQLAAEKDYDLTLLRRVLRCAFQMSEENLGAIFVLGEANTILQRSDASEISAFAAIVSADIENLSDRELINFAKQDGATVIDIQGQFRGCMVLLRPRADTEAEIGPGKGARHSSAAKMSAEAQCLAITVSQDGPITIYDAGRRVLSL